MSLHFLNVFNYLTRIDFPEKENGAFNPDGIEVLQLDNADCGLACLASIHAFYGGQITVSEIRCLLKTEIWGTSMLALAKTAQQLGYRAEGLKANKAYLRQLDNPVIAHLQKDQFLHYVVVYGIGPKSVRLMDPSVGGLRNMRLGQFLKQWTGYLLHIETVSKSPGFSNRLTERSPEKLDFEFLTHGWYKWLIIGSIQLGFLSLLFYSDLPHSSLIWICSLFYFFAFELILQALQKRSLNDLKRRELKWLKQSVKKMVLLPAHFFEGMSVDDMIKRAGDPSICSRYVERYLKLPLDFILLITLFLLLFIHSGHQSWAILLLLPMINSILTFVGSTIGHNAGSVSDRIYKNCLGQLSWLELFKGQSDFSCIKFWKIFHQAERHLFQQNTLEKEQKLSFITAVLQLAVSFIFGILFFIFEAPRSFDLFQVFVSFYLVLKLRAIATFFLFRPGFKRSSKRLQELLNFRPVE